MDVRWSLQSEQKILVGKAEHHASPVAAVELILVGDMLARGHEVGENLSERELVGKPAGAGRLEHACGKLRAAFDHGAGLELVLQPQLERRRLAATRIVVQDPKIALQGRAHLLYCG